MRSIKSFDDLKARMLAESQILDAVSHSIENDNVGDDSSDGPQVPRISIT